MARLAVLVAVAVAVVVVVGLVGGRAGGGGGEEEGYGVEGRAVLAGDWGLRCGVQRLLALRMAEAQPEVVLSVGDNFYSWGVEREGDPLFQSVFEEVFASDAHPGFARVPWLLALGNHDHRGSVEAQVAYSRTSPRWRMPGPYHRHDLRLGAALVHVLVLDTSPLVCPDVPHEASLQEAVYGDPECELYTWAREARSLGEMATWDDYQRMADETREANDRQLLWFEAQLAEVSGSGGWVVVVGHHALESASVVHGPMPRLQRVLGPLLAAYGADVYVAGHDHNLQHVRHPGSRLHHLVVGGGGFLTGPASVHPVDAGYPHLLHASSTFGFAVADFTPDSMHLAFLSHRGETVYNTTIVRGAE